jgi:hypothetical protein
LASGVFSTAGGTYSIAMGYNAEANHSDSFVWADDSASEAFTSTATNEFSIRAQNGVRIQSDVGIHLNGANEPLIVRDFDPFATNAPSSKAGIGRWGLFMEPFNLAIGIPGDDTPGRYFQIAKYGTNGTPATLLQVNQDGSTIVNGTVTANGVLLTSDRNAKEHFTALDGQAVLAKVAELPVTQWSYQSDHTGVQHIGPMAQDFQAAFQLSADDKHISVVDEGGVALAAIQGLNQKMEVETGALRKENAELKAELSEIKQALSQLAESKH